MPTYTLTVGTADGLLAGYYGLAPAAPGYWSAFGSVAPSGSAVGTFYWAPDGSAVSILATTPGGDLSVVWNGQTYTLTDNLDGTAAYGDVGLGGPYPTSGTIDFVSDEASPSGVTIIASRGDFDLTGSAVTFVRNRTIFADTGTYSVSGQDISFGQGYSATITVGESTAGGAYGYLSGSFGSIAWAGAAPPNPPTGVAWTASGTAVLLTSPVPGSIVINGQDYALAGSDGNYTYTAGGLGGPYPTSGTIDIIFVPGGSYSLSAGAGSFTLTGQDAAFVNGRVIQVEPGAYSLSGQDVGLLRTRILAADTGGIVLTGQDAVITVQAGIHFSAETGAFVLTGIPVALSIVGPPVILAETGAFVLMGNSANIYWMDEMTVPWPETLPQFPDPNTWTEKPQPNRISFTPEAGPTIDRRRGTARSYLTQADFTVSDAQLAAFWEFYETDLADGVLPFEWAHPVTATLHSWKIEPGSEPSAAWQAPDLHRLSMVLRRLP